MSAIPVIICGKTEQMASAVIAGLQPEYEVIHLILTPSAGSAQLPLILSGREAPSDSALGTKNYAQVPAAVLVGAGYVDDEIEQMRAAVAAAAPGARQVPWLAADKAVDMPPPGPEYGRIIIARIKAKLADMREKGQMEGAELVLF